MVLPRDCDVLVVGAGIAGGLADRIGRIRVMQLAAILFVAVFGKLAGTYAAARLLGVPGV